MGEVYLASDNLLNRRVAIKVLSGRDLHLGEKSRLLKEAQVIAKFNHHNIISIFDVVEDQARSFIVMEYFEGVSLEKLIPLPVETALDVIRQICHALEHAHKHDLIHRDLKPENILVGANNFVKLTDFGLAVELSAADFQEDALVGSVNYMSPEQIQGLPLDRGTDMYALGVIIYELLTGELPFEGEDMLTVLRSHLFREVVPPIEYNPQIPEGLNQVILKLLEKDRSRRLTRIQELINVIDLVPKEIPQEFRRLLERIPQPPAFLEKESPRKSQDSIFVGRDEELAELTEVLDRTLQGIPQFAFVIGEAGSGKSILLERFTRQCLEASSNVIIVKGSCSDFTGRGEPYLPFREILTGLTGGIEDQWKAGVVSTDHAIRLWNLAPFTIRAIVEAAPDLLDLFVSRSELIQRLLVFRTHAGTEIESLLQRLFAWKKSRSTDPISDKLLNINEGFWQLLKAISNEHPLILVLDDLHWVDVSTSGLLQKIRQSLRNEKIMIVGAYRSEEIARMDEGPPEPLRAFLDRLKDKTTDLRIDLDLANKVNGRLLLDRFLDSEHNQLGREFREQMWIVTGGNPFFISELLQDLRDRGKVVRDEERSWVQVEQINWNQIPVRVEKVIENRVHRLDHDLQKLLRIASVEGEVFTAEVIAGVLEKDVSGLLSTLSNQLDQKHHLVLEKGFRRSGLNRLSLFRFRHILIQRYLYEQLGEAEKVYLHDKIGNILEEKYSAEAEEIAVRLAHHYKQAENPVKAFKYLHLAGKLALEISAFEEAVIYLEQGKEYLNLFQRDPILDDGVSLLERVQFTRRLGDAYYGKGDLNQSKELFRQAVALVGKSAPGTHTYQGIFGLVLQIIRQIIHRLVPPGVIVKKEGQRVLFEEAAQIYKQLSEIYLFSNDLLQTAFSGIRTLNLAERAGPSRILACAYGDMAAAMPLMRIPWAGALYRRKAVEIARQLDDTSTMAYVLHATGLYALEIGEWEACMRALIPANEIYFRLRKWSRLGIGKSLLANAYYYQGRFNQSRTVYAEIEEMAARVGNAQQEIWGRDGQAENMLRMGEPGHEEQVIRMLEKSLSGLEGNPDHAEEIREHGLLAVAYLRHRDDQKAEEHADAAYRLCEKSRPSLYSTFEGYSGMTETYLALWQTAVVAAEIDRHKKRARQSILLIEQFAGIFPIGRPRAAGFKGCFERLSGNHERAFKIWNKGLDAALKLEMPYEIGRLHLLMGENHELGTSERDRHLKPAADIFSEIGARHDLDQALYRSNPVR